MSKITSKYEDKRAREELDKRTNETADRYMCWDVDHHIFGLHFAARHTTQCTHAACTIQRACRRAIACDWGMPSLIDAKDAEDASSAPWLGLPGSEHDSHNGHCRYRNQCLHADYMPVGGYCAVFSLTPAQSVISVGDSTLFMPWPMLTQSWVNTPP